MRAAIRRYTVYVDKYKNPVDLCYFVQEFVELTKYTRYVFVVDGTFPERLKWVESDNAWVLAKKLAAHFFFCQRRRRRWRE